MADQPLQVAQHARFARWVAVSTNMPSRDGRERPSYRGSHVHSEIPLAIRLRDPHTTILGVVFMGSGCVRVNPSRPAMSLQIETRLPAAKIGK